MSFYQRSLSTPSVRALVVLLGLVSCLFFLQCGPGGGTPDAGDGACQSKSDCPSNEVCRSKKCVVPTNIAPNADAGPDQNVQLGEKVLLDARNSYDEDGDNLTFKWSLRTKPADSKATLEGADKDQASFTPDKPGKYIVLLVANDGSDDAEDELVINVEKGENFPPEAKIKGDATITVAVGATVQLDGSESSDKNQDQLTYTWSLAGPSGSQAKLSDAAAAKPTFEADAPGEYTITLKVNDGEVDSKNTANLTVTAVKDFDKEPKIDSLDPTKAPADSITDIKITGMDLVDGAVVLFRNREVPTVYASNTELKVSLELLGVAAGKYPLVVKNPNGKKSNSVELEVIEVPTPTITELTPNKAGQGAKFKMEIKGTGFVQASKAFFTGTELKTTYKSDTLLEVEVDLTGRAVGTYPISVQNPGGKKSAPSNFEVTIPPPPPEITILNPDRGKSGAQIDFTVFGKRFDKQTVIVFNNKVIKTTYVGGGEIKADPKLDLSNIPAGTYKVKVRDNFGIDSKEEDFVVTDQFPTPTITSLAPSNGITGTKMTIAINGSNIDAGVKGYFNNQAVKTTFKTNALAEIEVDMTNVPVGMYDVYVANPGPNGTERKSNVFKFEVKPLPAPRVTSVLYSPLYSLTPGAIIVNGQGFTPSTVVQTTSRGQYSSSTSICARGTPYVDRTTTYVSPTQLIVKFTMPSSTSSSTRYFAARVKRGTLFSNHLCFLVNYTGAAATPTISTLTPVAVTEGTKSPVLVQIKGSNFDRVASVTFKSKAVSKVTWVSASQLNAEFDITGMKAGDTADVVVTNPSGKASSAVKFSIIKQGQPLIQSISPGTIYAGSSYTLTLNGQGFDASAKIEADGKPITGTVRFVSAAQMQVTGYAVPQGTRGSISVVVINPSNVRSNTYSVSIQLYPAPVLSSVSPTSAQEGSTISTFYLYGSNFRRDTTVKNKVQLGSSASKQFDCTYSSTTRLYCYKVPLTGFPQGKLDVRAVNPDGQTSNVRQITITAPIKPRITSVSPLTGINNQTVTLSIRGSYFNSASMLMLGTKSFPVTFSSSSSITVKVDLTTFTQGLYPLLIRNTIGGTNYDSNAYNFVVTDPPTPVVTYFTPMIGETGKKVTVTIYGTDFNSGSKVMLNGVAQKVNSSTSTRLTVEFDLSTVMVGKYTLQIDNGSGKKSQNSYFNVVPLFPPEITRINPAGVNHTSSNTTITIDGRNFHPNATVSIKGSNVGLASRSATKLTFATVFPSALYPNGSKNEIKVTNPDGKSARTFLYVYNSTHPVISYLSPASSTTNRTISTFYAYGRNLSSASPRYMYIDNVRYTASYANSSYMYYRSYRTSATSKIVNVYASIGGKISNIVPFAIGAVTPPRLDYINPSSGKLGGSVTLNLRGSGFNTSPIAKVYFDGKVYTPTGSASSLSVTIPLTGQTAGSKEVYVENTAGSVSQRVLFSIYP